jgi:hypothetical protein
MSDFNKTNLRLCSKVSHMKNTLLALAVLCVAIIGISNDRPNIVYIMSDERLAERHG